MESRPDQLIAQLGLLPHPEGGHYREVFRSGAAVRPSDGRPERAALTAIFFLLASGEVSRWHRVGSDEVWHFYEGDPLDLLVADPDFRDVTRARLGPVGGDARPVRIVPSGHWQAARPLGAYTLVGCTVGPGFDFADFTMLRDVPAAADLVRTWHPEVAVLL